MFNPIKASNKIKEEFVSYIKASFSFCDASLRNQFENGLGDMISKGPYLELNDSFKSGAAINELIEEGVLSPLFADLEKNKPTKRGYKKVLPLDRPLYYHQEQAIKKLVSGKNAVISTGTGSGKTNCFLIPVINELLREKENGTLNDGIRALFIYPMNALANDQLKNIRKLLMYYPDIKFGVYNGNTEEKEDNAIDVYESMFANEDVPELKTPLKNELLSREEMKETPPHILFTNYAMLEHLLFRPNDDVLFSHSDFRFVVLDEAHIYSGATGIETSLLLRRLRARITSKEKTQFILTSATLGSDSSSDDNIVKFAQNLTGEVFTKEDIIRSTRNEFVVTKNGQEYSKELINELADEQNAVKDVLEKYGIAFNESSNENELLYDFLIDSKLYGELRMKAQKISSIHKIQEILGLDVDTTVSFISLCTRAQKNGKVLVDCRYHFFIRSLEGCFIALNQEKKLFLSRQKTYYKDNEQYAVFEIAICDQCGRFALVGQIKDKRLVQCGKLGQKVEYFYLDEDDNGEELENELEIGMDSSNNKKEVYYLCPHCGAIIEEDAIKNKPCDCNQNDYIKIIKARELKSGPKCGTCNIGNYKRLYLGNDASTSVLATSLYEELPELVYEEADVSSSIKSGNIFMQAAEKEKKQQKKSGRQFLVFSDSRQEAAKFACYLTKSYQEFLRRRGICHILEKKKSFIKENEYTISDMVKDLSAYFCNMRCFAESNNDNGNLSTISRRMAWVGLVNELARQSSSTSLTSLGLLQFEYKETEMLAKTISDGYNIDFEQAKNLVNLLIMEIVNSGAICTDDPSDIDDNDREYIFYSSSQRFITKLKRSEEKRKTITSWLPNNKENSSTEFIHTKKMNLVMRFLGISEEDAVTFLENIFDYLSSAMAKCHFESPNNDKTYVLPAKFFKIRIPNDNTRPHWYKCKKCGKVSPYNIKGKCVVSKCDGDVEEVSSESLYKDNHFANLYFSDRMSPLFIKEHTAQLSKRESAEYQEEFIKKEINALSCSTTFEMGVDVGDLETVFLRDVPPLPSNYAQRAGRAGRSINAAAYALTFAKLSSHDLSYFKDPSSMISGVIMPPLFKIDNEKIVRRHIYAIALSMYFASNPDQYNRNNADKFINEKGYERFFEWLLTKPERLKGMLIRSIPDTDNLHKRMGIDNFSWLDGFIGNGGVLSSLLLSYENTIKEFENIIKSYKKDNDLDKASKCSHKLQNFKSNKLIDFLARGNVLPRYGFPVDTVELEQNTTANNINKLRLTRDLSIAIAEYAPSSEVIADGKLYTSRYIKKTITDDKKEWTTAYIGECPNEECKAINYSITPIPKEGIPCSSCGKIMKGMDFHESIEPRSGFVTERTAKDVPMTRQEKNYKSEDFYIGNTESKTIEKHYFRFGDVKVKIESTTNDSLMVKSYNNFYVCKKCGFAYAADEIIPKDTKATKMMLAGSMKITTETKHDSLFGEYKCDCQELKRYSLHHVFNTDVAKISFDCDTSNYQTMISTLYALLYAMSDLMNIERKDIKACLQLQIINGKRKYSIIIYDAVPGGAGHSRRLVTEDGKVLSSVIAKARQNMEACDCDPSCYKCLRSYENQMIHDDLDRKLALEFLNKFVGEAIPVTKEEETF